MNAKVHCVIMGGGRGSRLQPLTRLRAKPAVPLAGKYRLVDIPISNCINSGLNRIFVLTQFNTASLHQHIQDSYRFDHFGGGFVDILSAEQTAEGENWYQGTADAVRHNLHHFGARDGDLFLILSGDQLYQMDFREIVEQHRRSGAEVTLAAKPTHRSKVQGFGVMAVDNNLAVLDFVEKPTDDSVISNLEMSPALCSRLGITDEQHLCLANMGIYVFNKRTLFRALEESSLADFSKDLLPNLLGRTDMRAFVFQGPWEDIGTVRSFFEVHLSLTAPCPPFDFFRPDRVVYTHVRYLPASRIINCRIDRAIVADGCRIDNCQIERSVIGVRSSIRSGSRLSNVVMMGQDDFEAWADRRTDLPAMGIGKDCVICNAIIDKNARIGNGVRLCPDGREGLHMGDIVVRDGVLVVSKNGIVPDGTVLEP